MAASAAQVMYQDNTVYASQAPFAKPCCSKWLYQDCVMEEQGSLDYQRDIRGANPLQMQLLSLVDTKMTLKQHLQGGHFTSFYNGEIVHPP